MSENKTRINWYPGHMAAAKRMLEENIKLIDIIIEVRDARIPIASANPDIAKFNKPQVLILNKSDLADGQKTRQWLEYFSKNGIYAAAVNGKTCRRDVLKAVEQASLKKAEALKAKGINRQIRALVAGIPNVGKSTIINTLSGATKAKTGDKPGVTRGKQWIKTPAVDLLDSPGLLWPKLENQTGAQYLAFTGAINDDIFDLEELALMLIDALRKKYPDALQARYGITLGQAPLDDYEAICKKRGFLLRNGEYDYLRGAKVILDEFRGGIIGRVTLEEPNEL